MATLDRFSRRKVVGGCKLIAAHKEEGCGQVWLWYRTGSLYPYRVTTREATGEHITWRSALKEFKSLIGKNEVKWSI